MRKLSMDELGRKSIEEFKEAKKHNIVVVLDNIRSMHNVGSVFRTADAFLIKAIMLCGYTPQPPHRDINKTALGATDSVDWLYYNNTSEAIAALKENNFIVLGVEQTAQSKQLQKFNFDPENHIAFVMGNEVEGVSDEVLKLCDGFIEIPQFGMKHSLNISVAAGIVLWEAIRSGLPQ